MSSLGSYHYLTGVLFIILTICDIAFYSQFGACPIDNSAAGIFLFMIILNMFLTLLSFCLGYLINYFDNLDPEQMLDMGWYKKTLGISCKVVPALLKTIHYIKVIFVLIGGYFSYMKNSTGMSYLSDPSVNLTALIVDCRTNSTYVQSVVANYPKEVVVFETIELCAVIFTICFLGMIKNFINIDGYFYEPDDLRHGKLKKILFRRFGP